MKGIKDILQKLNLNPYWIFLLSISTIWDLISKIIAINQSPNTMTPTTKFQFDWFAFFFQMITITLLFIVWRSAARSKREFTEKMEILSLISFIRNRFLFIKLFDDVQFFRVPGETDAELWERLPQGGEFKKHLHNEYLEVRKFFEKTTKHKTINEIEILLKKHYPSSFFEAKKERQ